MHDPIEMITREHRETEELFKRYEDTEAQAYETKLKIVRILIRKLKLHMEMEERFFYPMAEKSMGKDGAIVEEGIAEHDVAKRLLEELSVTHPEDPQFDARIKVLNENIAHHIMEEEQELLPKAQNTLQGEDMASIGEEMARFRHEHEDTH